MRNTISDKKMVELKRRAQAAEKESIFSRRLIQRRKADEKQRRKAHLN
jgi:hypothetical protein